MKKTAIVTGARRGIGLAIAKKLLEGGYRVVLCATTAAGEVTTLLEELNRLGEAYYLQCDISRPEDRDNLLDQVLERFWPPGRAGEQRRRGGLQAAAEHF